MVIHPATRQQANFSNEDPSSAGKPEESSPHTEKHTPKSPEPHTEKHAPKNPQPWLLHRFPGDLLLGELRLLQRCQRKNNTVPSPGTQRGCLSRNFSLGASFHKDHFTLASQQQGTRAPLTLLRVLRPPDFCHFHAARGRPLLTTCPPGFPREDHNGRQASMQQSIASGA